RSEALGRTVRALAANDLPVLPGRNQVDLKPFTPEQAHQVLTRIGQAYRHISENVLDLNFEQRQFLHQAVVSLTEDGVVSPLRLAQFAHLVRNLAWQPNTMSLLGGVGGAGGLAAALMERAFDSPSAEPDYAAHADAVRGLIQALTGEENGD